MLFQSKNSKHVHIFIDIVAKIGLMTEEYIVDEILDLAQIVLSSTSITDVGEMKHALIK